MYASKSLLLSIVAVIASGAYSAGIQYQKCTPNWKQQGCKVDYHHNLTIVQDDRLPNATVKIDWDNLSGYEHDLTCRCRAKASAARNTWFAINKQGICLSAKGKLTDYLALHPLDDSSKCIGNITIISSNAPDGSACTLGVYRAYFFMITQPQVQSAPVQHGQEQAHEEQVAENPAPAPEEEVAANPAPAPEEEVAANPAPAPEEEVAANPAPAPKEEKIVDGSCKATADVILIMDVSGSLSYLDFAIEQKFALEFLGRFDLSKSRIGIITYSTYVDSVLTWNNSSQKNLDELKTYVEGLVYSGGSTQTQFALNDARTQIVEPQRRENVPITIILMTDGVTFGGSRMLKEPARILRDVYKCKMVAIGVGNYDMDDLNEITGQNADNIILKDNFSSLGADMGDVMNKLLKKSCI